MWVIITRLIHITVTHSSVVARAIENRDKNFDTEIVSYIVLTVFSLKIDKIRFCVSLTWLSSLRMLNVAMDVCCDENG